MPPDIDWKQTFTQLYEQHSTTVYTRCFWELCGDRGAAEDATQATFMIAMNRLRNGGPTIGNMRAWLLTVAHSQALEQMRRPQEMLQEPDPGLADNSMDTEADALSAVAPQEALALLTAAMPALEPENRRILSLNLQEERGELTRSDVNEILERELGMRAGAVKKRIFELRKKDGILSQALTMVMLLPTRRRDCPGLAAVVDKTSETVTPTLRKAVAAHIRQCLTCETQRRWVSDRAIGLASAAPVLPAPTDLWAHLQGELAMQSLNIGVQQSALVASGSSSTTGSAASAAAAASAAPTAVGSGAAASIGGVVASSLGWLPAAAAAVLAATVVGAAIIAAPPGQADDTAQAADPPAAVSLVTGPATTEQPGPGPTGIMGTASAETATPLSTTTAETPASEDPGTASGVATTSSADTSPAPVTATLVDTQDSTTPEIAPLGPPAQPEDEAEPQQELSTQQATTPVETVDTPPEPPEQPKPEPPAPIDPVPVKLTSGILPYIDPPAYRDSDGDIRCSTTLPSCTLIFQPSFAATSGHTQDEAWDYLKNHLYWRVEADDGTILRARGGATVPFDGKPQAERTIRVVAYLPELNSAVEQEFTLGPLFTPPPGG